MKKQPISIRLDGEIIRYFREACPSGYQRAIRDVLQSHVKRQRQKESAVVGRAQQIYVQYYASCFWHMRPDLTISTVHLPMIRDRLQMYGGREGFLLSIELELNSGEK